MNRLETVRLISCPWQDEDFKSFAAARHGFDTLMVQEIVSFTARDNLRSRRVMEKPGIRYKEEFTHPTVDEDSPLNPHVLYKVTKEEFNAFTAA